MRIKEVLENGYVFYVPEHEYQEFEMLMLMDAFDNTGIYFKVLIDKYANIMNVYQREIQERIADAFNACDSLAEQLLFLEGFPEIRVKGSKVYIDKSTVKFNDLWLN
jgi:bacterioferritin (cytochrome b1)